MTTTFAVAILLIFLRVAGFVAFLPPFSGRHTPQTVKIGLVCALTALWAMKLTPGAMLSLSSVPTDNWVQVVWLAGRETLFGAGLGWLLGLILVPVRVTGAYLVQEMGLTMAAMTSPTEGTESNVLSQALEVAAVLAIFGLNLHHEFLRLFDASFSRFPLGQHWTLPQRDWLIGTIIRSSDVGLALAAPAGIVLFAALVTTLFVMRQSPQFNLFNFGMPVRVFVGLAATFWFLPQIVTGMVHTLQRFTNFQGL